MTGPDVLLTGATGFAGSAVLPELLRSGRRVTALVREPITLAGADTLVGSLGMLEEMHEQIGAAASIVHLASGRGADRESVVFEDIVGTGQLLDAWRRGPFVYASTTTVHGMPRGVLRADTPVHVEDWYDCGKVVNEFQVRQAAAGAEGRGPGISLRPTLFFGPSARTPDRQYLAWFYYHALAGDAITFDSDEAMATIGASYVGTGDFARAVVAALGLTSGGAYPISGGFVTWRDLMDTFNRVAGTKGRWTVRRDGPQGDDEVRAGHSRTELDDSAFRRATGWSPRQSLEELVSAFVRAEREAGRA